MSETEVKNGNSTSSSAPEEPQDKLGRSTVPLTSAVVRALINSIDLKPHLLGFGVDFKAFFETLRGRGAEYRRSIEEQKLEIVKQLLELNVDPSAFDILLQNELDRKLKVRFGSMFLVLTLLFTTGSYAIVVFDAIYKWGISKVAITALIIETPIQFIGLLYIIARNLFPQNGVPGGSSKK